MLRIRYTFRYKDTGVQYYECIYLHLGNTTIVIQGHQILYKFVVFFLCFQQMLKKTSNFDIGNMYVPVYEP